MKSLKKFLCAVLVFAMIATSVVFTASAAGTIAYGAGTVSATTLNIRSGPGTNYSIVDTVKNGEIVVIIEKSTSEWYRINYDALDALRTSPSDEIRLMDKTKSTRPIPNINYKNKNGALAEKQTTVNSADSVDVDKFIEWYFVEYMNEFGEKHPSIRADQRERIRKTLADFIDDSQFDIYDNADLEEMARSFWANVESNDWRISHFATPGILKTRYYEEIWNK